MPPKTATKPTKQADKFGASHSALVQRGFIEKGWDPELTEGKQINLVVLNTINEDKSFDPLRQFFNYRHVKGGLKENNTCIYTNYKTQACEYILSLGLKGIRRKCKAAL